MIKVNIYSLWMWLLHLHALGLQLCVNVLSSEFISNLLEMSNHNSSHIWPWHYLQSRDHFLRLFPLDTFRWNQQKLRCVILAHHRYRLQILFLWPTRLSCPLWEGRLCHGWPISLSETKIILIIYELTCLSMKIETKTYPKAWVSVLNYYLF